MPPARVAREPRRRLGLFFLLAGIVFVALGWWKLEGDLPPNQRPFHLVRAVPSSVPILIFLSFFSPKFRYIAATFIVWSAAILEGGSWLKNEEWMLAGLGALFISLFFHRDVARSSSGLCFSRYWAVVLLMFLCFGSFAFASFFHPYMDFQCQYAVRGDLTTHSFAICALFASELSKDGSEAFRALSMAATAYSSLSLLFWAFVFESQCSEDRFWNTVYVLAGVSLLSCLCAGAWEHRRTPIDPDGPPPYQAAVGS